MRVTKVTLELADGTIENYTIGDNDSVACFMVSKEQDFNRWRGYSGDIATTGLILLDDLVQAAKNLESSIRVGRWQKLHQN